MGSTSFGNTLSIGSKKFLSRDPVLSHLVNGDRCDTTTTLVSDSKSNCQDTWRNKPQIQVQGVSPKSRSAPARSQHTKTASNETLTIQGKTHPYFEHWNKFKQASLAYSQNHKASKFTSFVTTSIALLCWVWISPTVFCADQNLLFFILQC